VKDWNAVPYKQVYKCCRDDDNTHRPMKDRDGSWDFSGWCYLENRGTEKFPNFQRVHLRDLNAGTLSWQGVSIWPTNPDELAKLEIPVITWELRRTSRRAVVTRAGLTSWLEFCRAGSGNTYPNLLWVSFVEAITSEHLNITNKGLTWEWLNKDHVYEELFRLTEGR